MSAFLCSGPSRLSYGPSQLWRTKAWPARGLRACFGGQSSVSCLLHCGGVLVCVCGGGGLCPLWNYMYQLVEYWNILVWDE